VFSDGQTNPNRTPKHKLTILGWRSLTTTVFRQSQFLARMDLSRGSVTNTGKELLKIFRVNETVVTNGGAVLHLHVLICDIPGRRSLAPPPGVMLEIERYVIAMHKFGLKPAEIAADIAQLYPSAERVIEVEEHSDNVLCILVKPRELGPGAMDS